MISSESGPPSPEDQPTPEAHLRLILSGFCEALDRESAIVRGDASILDGSHAVIERIGYQSQDAGLLVGEAAHQLDALGQSAYRLRQEQGRAHDTEFGAARRTMANLGDATDALDHIISTAERTRSEGEEISGETLMRWLKEQVRQKLVCASEAHSTQSELVMRRERANFQGSTHSDYERRDLRDRTTYKKVNPY